MSLTKQEVDSLLALDYAAEAKRIGVWLRESLRSKLHRRGLVVAISGGIDSSVSAALAVAAVGRGKVFGLLMPERDSSSNSSRRGKALAEHLGIEYTMQDIAPVLEAIGCYQSRDDAIRQVLPAYNSQWKSKIVIAGALEGRINHFRLVAQSPSGDLVEETLPLEAYLTIVAATNHKQRVRKTLEYFHADRLNYAVVGTPNRLEYDQGFFVKNGDGSADIKPIAHLFKSQVYAMARHLGLPKEICEAIPTTDTYSLSQGQDEFYFALPYHLMDVALWSLDRGTSPEELASLIRVDAATAGHVYADIRSKRSTTAYLHLPPVLIEPRREVGGHA
jgi:NAD+ synthase